MGCGGAEDAASYGDEGADTLGHIAEPAPPGLATARVCAPGRSDFPASPRWGSGRRWRPRPAGARRDSCAPPPGQWGYGVETSRGKDTPSGHWEIAGTPVDFAWGYFPETIPALPAALSAAMIAQAGLTGILADRHASGTEVIAD